MIILVKMNKALVIGAGVTGLITARMLSDFYEDVCLIERDELPKMPANRQGTPQAFHPHRVLPRGSIILERYFPDYIDELLVHGAPTTSKELLVTVNHFGERVIQQPVKNASSSRALLEWVLRQRVQRINNIRFVTKTEVTGLISSEDHQTIIGVYTKGRGENKQEVKITGDMVIDTSGRSSKAITWLNSLGYTLPEPEVLKVSLGYSTQYYKIPPHAGKEWRTVLSEGDSAKGICAGMMIRIEDNIVGALLYSAGGNYYPSTNPNKFQEELTYLKTLEIAETVSKLEPLQGARGYRVQESIRQHFEKMENWPSGLLILGDAFCSFDPIYGQGITVAAIEAETVANCLSEERSNPQPHFERRVLQQMQKAIEPAWWLSAIADLRWKGVEHVGTTPIKGAAFAQKYIDLFTKKVMNIDDAENSNLFITQLMVNALVLPPSEIFNAKVLTMILNDNGSPEELELRSELGVQDPEMYQQRIEELIPSFDSAFDERLKDVLVAVQKQQPNN